MEALLTRSASGRPAWLASPWIAAAFLLLLASAAEALTVLNGGVWTSQSLVHGLQSDAGFISALTYGPAGALILSRLPRHPIGRIFLFLTAVTVVGQFSSEYAIRAYLTAPSPLPLRLLLAWLSQWTFDASSVGLSLIFLAFPDGFDPRRRWQAVLGLAVLGGLLLISSALLAAGPSSPADRGDQVLFIPVNNPTGVIPPQPDQLLGGAGWAITGLALVLSVLAMILRLVHSSGERREQLKWMAYFAMPVAPLFIAHFLIKVLLLPIPDYPGELRGLIYQFGVPIATVIAILKYRLYDLDLIVSRALLYGSLSLVVAAAYLATGAAIGHLISTLGPATPVAATVIGALIALALRQPVQRAATRLVYGRRREPMALLNALSVHLQAPGGPDELLQVVSSDIKSALKLEQVGVQAPDGEWLAGGEPREEMTRLPLVHQGEFVGDLVLVTSRGDRLSSLDLRAMDELRPQLAALIQAALLKRDLLHSRERLATVLEEERRRLRHDLHDGLGPILTAVALRADAAKNLLRSDPDRAEQLLMELRQQASAAVADVRRLVYGLRPPALDDVGLVGAIRQQAEAFAAGRNGADPLAVLVDAPPNLPSLPAAVEVAAYRIAAEAMTNAARHARARACRVRLRAADTLELEVEDDGQGWEGELRPGVGLTSMRERATALGGSLSVTREPSGGVRVRARLPVSVETVA